MATSNYTSKDVKRFWSKVAISPDFTKCWEWQRPTVGGYGIIAIGGRKGRMIYAHRFSYEIAHGEIPNEMKVLHECDNPICVNPAHLFLGTQADNMRDMNRKGRHADVKGEKNRFHKLTAEQVRYVRNRFATGAATRKELAVEMGVTTFAIQCIINRKTWKHVE